MDKTNVVSFPNKKPISANKNITRVVAITSGKGGVGKTTTTLNLAVALARFKQRVVIFDADLGLGNIDILLGLRPKYNLSHVVNGEKNLTEILVQGPAGINIIPATSGLLAMSNLSMQQQAGIINSFNELENSFDVLMIDTAAGLSDNVITFTQAAQEVLLVVCNDPASLTDAYAMIKVLHKNSGIHRFHIISNMVHTHDEGCEIFAKLSRVAENFIGVYLNYLGSVPFDITIKKVAQAQKIIMSTYPSAPASQAYRRLAEKILSWPAPKGCEGRLQFFVDQLIHYECMNPQHG